LVKASLGVTETVVSQLEPGVAFLAWVLFRRTSTYDDSSQNAVHFSVQGYFHITAQALETVLIPLSQAVVNAVLHANPIDKSESINALGTECIFDSNAIWISDTKSISEVKAWQASDTSVIAEILTTLNKEITQIVLKYKVSGA
jgi:hypothetical protein